MQYKEFADLAAEKMKSRFPDMEIHLQRVEKLQNQSYNALVVKAPDDAVGMTFNMDGFYQKWCDGADSGLRPDTADPRSQEDSSSLDAVFDELEQMILHAEPHPPMVDVETLRSYLKMRECLSMQLVPAEGNEAMLKRVPHLKRKDLAIVFRFLLPGGPSEEASVLLTNDLLLSYEVTAQQVEEDAFLICPANRPMVIRNMEEVLLGIRPCGDGDSPQCGLWVVSNDSGRNGAAVIFYPGAFETIADQFGCGYYLIPSSVHEMLAVPDPMCIGAEQLDQMVESVNAAEVSEEDRLTDHCYHYDPETKLFETGKEYEKRIIGRRTQSRMEAGIETDCEMF